MPSSTQNQLSVISYHDIYGHSGRVEFFVYSIDVYELFIL